MNDPLARFRPEAGRHYWIQIDGPQPQRVRCESVSANHWIASLNGGTQLGFRCIISEANPPRPWWRFWG